mgnify:CR=1 FL=1
MLYRIFTEKTNVDLNPTINKYFDGYTIINAQGYWKGISEHSVIIEIVAPIDSDLLQLDEMDKKITLLAIDIKYVNKQESVLIQTIEEGHLFV